MYSIRNQKTSVKLLQLYEVLYHETEIEFDLCDNDTSSILVNRVKKPSPGHILLSRFVKH
jgi:hypothetical protein